MDEEYRTMLENALKGIELTKEERITIEWIAGLDLWTVQQVCQIIRKCHETR